VGLPELTPAERSAAASAALAARHWARWGGVGQRRIDLPAALDLAGHDQALAKMRVVDLLGAMPRIGPVRASEIMERNNVAATRRIRGLGERQRSALLAEFDK
jgi:hypothetical protein